MKKSLLLLAVLAFVCSPLLVSSAAAQGVKGHKHHHDRQHHAKHHAKHHHAL
jgi:Ni/Co efflux regulator RcnB